MQSRGRARIQYHAHAPCWHTIQVRKLLMGVNTALFKLLNGGAGCRGAGPRLQDAVVEVVRALVGQLKAAHRGGVNLPYSLRVSHGG